MYGKVVTHSGVATTSTEIMTPKTFFQTFKIYNEMHILSYHIKSNLIPSKPMH